MGWAQGLGINDCKLEVNMQILVSHFIHKYTVEYGKSLKIVFCNLFKIALKTITETRASNFHFPFPTRNSNNSKVEFISLCAFLVYGQGKQH